MHEPVKKYQLKEGQLKHLMGDLGRLDCTLTTETKIYEQAQPGDRSLVPRPRPRSLQLQVPEPHERGPGRGLNGLEATQGQ